MDNQLYHRYEMCLEVTFDTGCAALLLDVITLHLKLRNISIHTSVLNPYFNSPEKPTSMCIGYQKRSFIQSETNNDTPYRSDGVSRPCTILEECTLLKVQ
jgi:hypothetical protein